MTAILFLYYNGYFDKYWPSARGEIYSSACISRPLGSQTATYKRAKIIWHKLARYVSYYRKLTVKTAVKHYTVNKRRI